MRFSAPASLAAARDLAWLRVLVVGSAGAGKTTFAVRLAALLDLPLIHLDFEYWRPGWQPKPSDEWPMRVDELIAREAWVMDGNYGGTMERRLTRADAAVFLDVNRVRCLWRVVVRSLRYWRRSRPDLPPGCSERLDWGFWCGSGPMAGGRGGMRSSCWRRRGCRWYTCAPGVRRIGG